MHSDRDLWRAIRWPLLVLALAVVGIVVAAAVDRTTAREWALTIGGPALTVLLPVGPGMAGGGGHQVRRQEPRGSPNVSFVAG